MKSRRFVLSVLALAAVVVLASCSLLAVHRRPRHKCGPPPHAPAHGHRHKNHDDVQLAYDSGRGVYVVVGIDDHYYWNGHYYRLSHSGWQVSVSMGGRWKPASEESLPVGLKVKKKAKHASKRPSRSRGR
ncbi:MAG: hypothetical protein ACYTBJ_14665 [Planctomycetota bacterium]|jgi:hypothetical protein